jgi:C-terminal processing protease CtpA/Prc
MVGRLRNNRVSIIGESSADEWRALIDPLCAGLEIGCQLGGDGYGPSDQTPFYAAGVPVLHFFTGAHEDYHTPSDTTDRINAAGGARIAHLVAALAAELAQRDGLTYQASQAPGPVGDPRGYGASLGTIPDYADTGEGRAGMLLAGVRSGGPAEQAGLQRGDRIVELAGSPVGDIYDLMYVLQSAKPGDSTTVVVERNGERIALPVTFGTSTR